MKGKMNSGKDFPIICNLQVNKVFRESFQIVLYHGITTFIGPNGIGKTQTLKALRDYLKQVIGQNAVRYLSSNRIGLMEQYRSKISQYNYSIDDFQIGDQKTKSYRHEIETSTGDFFTMDERKDVYIKVAERLSVLFGRQIYLRWDSGNMKVFFERKNGNGEYSVAAEASGLVNVISILAALFDEEIKILLIDEPEVSLHPQLQSYLLREMREAVKQYGKTIILSTHSAEMISLGKISDLSRFIFFTENNLPIQVKNDLPELNNKKLNEFVIRMGQVYKNGFFAKRILLIEGTSDFIICQYLADRKGFNLDVAGTEIIPVDGKGQFPVVAKLFRLINKEVSILTDLDGFIDDNSIVDIFGQLPKAKEIACESGDKSIGDMVRRVKTKLTDMINKHMEDMKRVYQTHPYWINKKTDDDELIVAKRAMVGSLFCSSDDEIRQWNDSQEWIYTKKCIEAVMKALAELGCFILKKGAIESYYLHDKGCINSEKPSAAVEEVSFLEEKDMDSINMSYFDVINAIQYVSTVEEIDESYAVKKELLSEIALVLEIIKKDIREEEIYSAIKQAKNNAASLFEYTIVEKEERRGVRVGMKSIILKVKGFPFEIYVGDNVNEIVELNIKNK